MQLRSEFAETVSQQASISPEALAQRCFTFTMAAEARQEGLLADEFERTGRQWLQWKSIGERAVARLQEARSLGKEAQATFELRCVENLYCSLTSQRPYKFAPEIEKPARRILDEAESMMRGWLGWGKCEHLEEGVFALELHREPQNTWEIENWGILEPQPAAILYVDVRHEDGQGLAYLHPLLPVAYWRSRTA
jgi:hypothetical protein